MVVAIALGAAGAGALAALAWPWLRGGRYRYEHERDLRPLRPSWYLPTAALAGGAIAGARADDLKFAVVAVAAVVPLLALAAIDLDVRRLPDRITGPLALALVVSLLVAGYASGSLRAWQRALLAGLALGGSLLVVAVAGGGLGLGDVKLAPSLGLLLGYLGWSPVVVALLLAFVTGALHAVWLLAWRGGTRRSTLPFGPHLIAGTLLTLAIPALTTW